jgi:PAS domain S-box-containing protein
MKFYRNLSLKRKIVGVFIFSFVIGYLCVVYTSVYKTISLTNTFENEALQSHVIDINGRLNHHAESGKRMVEAIANHPFTYTMLQLEDSLRTDEQQNSFTAYLNKVALSSDALDLLMLCDKEGNVLAANSKDKQGRIIMSLQFMGRNVDKQDWFVDVSKFKYAYESNVTSNAIVHELYGDNRQGIVVAFPVNLTDGSFSGVLMGAFSLDEMVEQIMQDRLLSEQFNQKFNVYFSTINGHEYRINETGLHHLKNKSFSRSKKDLVYEMPTQHAIRFGDEKIQLIGTAPRTSFSFALLFETNLLLSFVLMGFFVYLGYFTIDVIVKRMNSIKKLLNELKDGRLSVDENVKTFNNDELTVLKRLVAHISYSLKEKVKFAEAIGSGSFSEEMKLMSDQDELGLSLLKMKDNLVELASNEKKQNWITQGLAEFVAILRSNNEDVSKLYDRIIESLTKYLKANQGGLFVLTSDEEGKEWFELMGCYAWDRKKYLNMRLDKGEGLVGQAWQEGEYILLKEVPDNFVRITSGLGESNPRNILIVPLKVNDEIFGAIELASFNFFETHEIEFVQKLSESIASTIATERINTRTKLLLEESQIQTREMEAQTEQLHAQEEEMRQNMEEMIATQEEMERAQGAMMEALEKANEKDAEATELRNRLEEEHKVLQAQFDAQLGIINETAIVSRTDLRGNITYANDLFCKYAKYQLEELIGQPHNIVRHEDMPAAAYEDLWKTISSGKVWKGQVKNKAKDGSYYWVQATIAPVMGENGKPKEYIAVRYLITEMKEKEDALNQMMEELRANEERMDAVNQEMDAQLSIINEVAIVSKTDLKGDIIFVNDQFLKWSKYSREEVMGHNHRILKSGDQDDQIFVDMWKTISSGNVFRGEIKNKAKDGSFYWVDAIIAPVLDENGKPKEYIAQRFVINEKKAQEKELNELRKQLGK